MKRTVSGPLLGLAILGVIGSALAQAPSASGQHGKAPGPGPSGGRDPRGPGHHLAAPLGSNFHAPSGFPSAMSSALRQRILDRMATFKSRRDANIAKLRGRFSELHLKSEPLRNELRRHARSLAFLNRARMIAQEELAEPKKAKVLKRIDVLLAKEQARHDRHVQRFTGAGAAPSGSAPPFASGFVPPPGASGRAAPPGSGTPKPKQPPAPAASAGGAK